MQTTSKRLLCIAFLILVAVWVGYYFHHGKSSLASGSSAKASKPSEAPKMEPPKIPSGFGGPQTDPIAAAFAASGGMVSGAAETPASIQIIKRIKDTIERLRGKRTAEDQQDDIRSLLRYLAEADLAASIPAVMKFLRSGDDFQLLSGIEIGPRGLESWSSLRVALLDFLGVAMPPAAADYARTIYETSDSPDEWAISLRNTSKMVPSSDVYLADKVRELITRPSWALNPTSGYLQAYDLAVHVGDPKLLDILERRSNSSDESLRQASGIALERLGASHTLAMLDALHKDSHIFSNSPDLRASFFARANVAESGQRSLVESYLLRSDVSSAEIQKFAALFPNYSAALSYNLVTMTTVPNEAEQASRDAAAQTAVSQWLQDPRFVNLRPFLTETAKRLQAFVDQATNAGLLKSK